ncbi:MAG: metal ABC transporter ATP-binding protein [Nocardioides sp.]
MTANAGRECLIRTRDVAVELGGRPVLRGIDLAVSPGEVVAVLGANGSGKSTLVRTLLGLVPTTRGEVRLFDTPLTRFRSWERVGFVPQRATAASGVPATVGEVVAAGRLSRRTPFVPLRRADRTAIAEAVAAVGLEGRLGDGVSTLSGGQQQRVLIARALAGEPELLVLDEPTAGVDVHSQQAFADTLHALVTRGSTIVLVAHELGPLAGLVGRAVVMRDGRLVYDGPPLAAFTDADHGHHHHADHRMTDHAPTVASPFDPPQTGASR